MPETTPLIKAALNLRGGAGFDVYETTAIDAIYLGIRMKQEEVQKFKELARKYELKLYQMVVVNGMYKIEFKEMKL